MWVFEFQAGPIERVNMPKDQRTGESRGIAFVEYSHLESVPYALQLFIGTKLHSRPLNMRSRNNSHPVAITPQYIEANNPLTAPGSSSLRNQGYNNGHMQPMRGRNSYGQSQQPANPFGQIHDPALLMALTANFQAQSAYQDLGRYDRDQDDHKYQGKHRGGGSSYRRHDDYNPYRNEERSDRGGGGGHRDRDRDRDWTNGNRSHGPNRKRF